MAGLPGSIPSLIPAGPDEQVRRMRDVERRVDELGPSVARSFKPVIDDLTAKQATLDAQQATLTTQQATLTTTVADLVTAQAALAAQNAQILALIGSQVYPVVAHVDANNFSLTSGANVEKVRATISVPTGYTQALVFATATLNMLNTTAAWDEMYAQVTIDGVTHGYSASTGVINYGEGTATKGIAGLLTGLGSTFYVNALASTWLGTWGPSGNNNVFNLDVMVMFLR